MSQLQAPQGRRSSFFSTTPELVLDPRSLHAGCPVGEGSENWVVTKCLQDKQLVADGGFEFAEFETPTGWQWRSPPGVYVLLR